jgi:broad specificity phosphatase PhoE
MLIRHGEKQDQPPPCGVNAAGDQDKHSLTARGWQRAGALVTYFRWPRVEGIVSPTAIFASAVGGQAILIDGEDASKSLRPQQTVTPLAAALALDVNTDWTVGQESNLAAVIRGLPGAVLVAWEHKHIPLIGTQFSPDVPAMWPDGAFDVVWVLTYSNGSYAFEQRYQSLLAGDTTASGG